MEFKHNISIAIADDHKIFRNGIKMALSVKKNITIIWEASNGKEMLEKIEVNKPEVLLMDLRMPEIDGIKGIQLIREQYTDIKIIVLTMFEERDMISKLMTMGANAYLAKTTDPDEIYNAIITCYCDEFYFNDLVNNSVMSKLIHKKNVIQNAAVDPTQVFTKSEISILQLMAQDKSTAEIASTLFLSPRTIETFRQNMKKKIDVKTVNGLLMYGINHGLIEQH